MIHGNAMYSYAESNKMSEKLRVFVLIPFDDEFNEIYTDLIKAPLEAEGFLVERADSRMNMRNIMRDVVEGIRDADLIVADLTNSNPNVFYELGISHGLTPLREIPTVLLTQSIDDVPFDLRTYRLLSYSTRFSEAPKLIQKLREVACELKSGNVRAGNPVSDFIQVDRVARKREASTIGMKESEDDVDRNQIKGHDEVEEIPDGAVDFLVDFEQSLEILPKETQRIGELTDTLTTELLKAPSLIEAEDGHGPKGSATRRHWVAKNLGAQLDIFSNDIADVIKNLRSAWEKFDKGSDWLILILEKPIDAETGTENESTKKVLQSFLDVMQDTGQKHENLLLATTAAKSVFSNLQGISKDLNRSAKRGERVYDDLIEVLKIGLARQDRMKQLVQKGIEKFS